MQGSVAARGHGYELPRSPLPLDHAKYTTPLMYVDIGCGSVNPATLSPVQMKSVYVSNAQRWSKQDLANLALFVFKAS